MPIRRSNDKQKSDWIKANKSFVLKGSIAEIFEKMQQDGLYSLTYTLHDAYLGLSNRIKQIFPNKK